MNARSVAFALIAMSLCLTTTVHGQGSAFAGKVVADSSLTPLAGVEVFIEKLGRVERTNERGEFRIATLPAGEYPVLIRLAGFAPKRDTIVMAVAGEVRRDYRLPQIRATLPEVPVTTTLLDRKLAEFHERRRMGIGRFLDSAEFANARGTRTSDRLRKLPGLTIGRGRFLSEAYVLSTRVGGTTGGKGCPAAVWLDGVNLWTDYSVNQLDPSMIAAVEWYAGEASLPAKFNVTPSTSARKYCGVLVIWTR